MPAPQTSTRPQEGRINGYWVSSVTATGFAIGGLVGTSLKIEDLLKVGCKVGAIPIVKFFLNCITLGWLLYTDLSTGPSFKVFKYCPRMPRKVFIVITVLLAALWLGMAMWTSAECSDTCTQCPKLALDSDIGTRFLWGIAGSVCTCANTNGQSSPSGTGATPSSPDSVPILEWRSVVSPDAISQLYNILHQYGIVVVLIICLISTAYLSHTEWNTATQEPDIPLGDVENGRAL